MSFIKNIQLFFRRLQRHLLHLRLQPIRVFCFHQVSDVFDPLTMWECDWMQTDVFKQKITDLQRQGYKFISLTEAHKKLKHDTFRFKKYAVLTADDGSKTLEDILQWLHNNNIPITLFINGSYLDGKTYRESPAEQYLTKEEVFCLTSRNIEISNHSWDHKDLKYLSMNDFEQSIACNVNLLSLHPRYIPFWAYPYGTHTKQSDGILRQNNIIPVFINGCQNYNNPNIINRELLR